MSGEEYQIFKDKKVLVTGGAGFVGSHLVDRLMDLGAQVVVVDNLVTGHKSNIEHLQGREGFRFIEADAAKPVATYFDDVVDFVFHLASPASPVDFEKIPVEIYEVNGFGTHYLCEYASKTGGRFLFASTSEAYGDPEEHPQKESYWGNVNPVGPRACYDESKRFGEMVTSTFGRKYNLDGRIVRIFNTYGPRMQSDDGRVIPTFIRQALEGRKLTIHGDGSQTRSFCYVSDLVEYLLTVMASDHARGEVLNIGNTDEYPIKEVAEKIISLTGNEAEVVYKDRPENDPSRRKPDLSKVIELTGFSPQVSFEDGLKRTIEDFLNRG